MGSSEVRRVSITTSDWEQAEILRSDVEARQTPPERLIADQTQVTRYLNPPLDTAYPLEYAHALLGNIKGKRVLDFGCGSGENTLVLAMRGAHVTAVDISPSLLALAARRLALNHVGADTEFVAASAYEMPVEDNSVDALLGIAILHHLDLAKAANEIWRVLKPGGLAVFQEPVRDSAIVRGLRKLIPYKAEDVSPYERPLTTAELKGFAAAFSVEAWRSFSLPFINVMQVVPGMRDYVIPAYQLDKNVIAKFPGLSHFAGIRVIGLRKPLSS
jgi:ubiquinone/menaquinone biosynthesis C-methylase UbiE